MSINRRVVRQLKGSLTWSDRKQALLSEDASSAHLGQPSDQSPTPLASNVNLDATHSQLQNLTDQIYDLCRRRDFAASHQIAMCMITLAPHLAVGYCRKADVYVLQGSTLEAIEILNKGLARVPVSSSESDLILAAKKRVREQMVDFVSRLPFDILCHVLKFIPDQPFLLKQCMLVSKTWRQHVSQCVPLWKEVQVASENYYCPNALVIIGSHIKKLHARLCSGVWLSILFRLMAKGVFANLKELKFYHVSMLIRTESLPYDE
ncbi:hypothetical protein BX666DRAFT_1881251 [Dichotomocladium elegans]|nr:hypothetical protein BX666DRAFT_1881251 [Dichotomocladium elegans]